MRAHSADGAPMRGVRARIRNEVSTVSVKSLCTGRGGGYRGRERTDGKARLSCTLRGSYYCRLVNAFGAAAAPAEYGGVGAGDGVREGNGEPYGACR